jgi:hypothetical protein
VKRFKQAYGQLENNFGSAFIEQTRSVFNGGFIGKRIIRRLFNRFGENFNGSLGWFGVNLPRNRVMDQLEEFKPTKEQKSKVLELLNNV